MSELPELGRQRVPGAPPRPEVLQAIVQQGRRRLRRAALSGGGALVTVIGLVLGTAVLGGSGNDALVVVPASPLPGGSASPAPSGAPEPTAEPSVDVAGPAEPDPQPVEQPGDSEGGSSAFGRPERPGQQPGGGGGAPGRALPPYREQPGRGGYGDACLGTRLRNAPAGYTLCLTTTTSSTVTRGVPVNINLDLCSSLRSRGPLTLSFSTGREHEEQVRRAGTADDFIWTWSRHHSFPEGAHQRELPRGECMTWDTTWSTRDDQGQLVPAGDYVVDSTVEINGREHTVTQPIRVQEPSPAPSPVVAPPGRPSP